MTESPFKRLTKNKNDIILMPKSGKYDYVYIFMHGLFTSPSIMEIAQSHRILNNNALCPNPKCGF